MWRHEDVFRTLGGGIDFVTGERITDEYRLSRDGAAAAPSKSLVLAPLMHGAAQWGTFGGLFKGVTVVLLEKFDPHAVWAAIEQHRIAGIGITGDAMAVPLIDAYVERRLRRVVARPARVHRRGVQPRRQGPALRAVPRPAHHRGGRVVGDAASTGRGCSRRTRPATTAASSTSTAGPTRSSSTTNNRPVQPGEIGRMARGGHVPLGYYKDPVKSAATFIEVEGKRYSVPGDFARLELDGTMTLLGRGSQCINSGGEKIYPEEVESAIKAHPAVFDALVVGLPDERWGQKVAALVAGPAGHGGAERRGAGGALPDADRRVQGAARCGRGRRGAPPTVGQTRLHQSQAARRGGRRMKNRLCEMFGIEFPIFAFSHCRDVVAAVTNAGGMGVLGALAFTPEQLELELKWIDEHVGGKPYGVDVVMPVKSVDRQEGIHERPRRAAAGDGPPDALRLRRQDPGRPRRDRRRAGTAAPPTATATALGRRAGSMVGGGVLGWAEATGATQIEVALAHDIALLASALGPPPKAAIDAGPRAGREGRRAHRPGRAGGARRATRASTSSSPRATRPGATPARWRRWCSSPTWSTPSRRCPCWPPAASDRAGRWPRRWRWAPTACGPGRSG